MGEKDQEFVCSYRFDGREYGITIHARDWKDASARLRAIGMTGSVDGILVMTIPLFPALPPPPLFARAFAAFLKFFRGKIR